MSAKSVTPLIDEDVVIPMRDGTLTRADIYRPGPGRYPVLLARLTWGKSMLPEQTLLSNPLRLMERGYAVVIQDSRGAHASAGSFEPYFPEVLDGYDSVEWCASQRWSTGVVGMFGHSQAGLYQWLAALERPPSLKAITPTVASGNTYEWAYQDGAFQLAWAIWFASTVARNQEARRATKAGGTTGGPATKYIERNQTAMHSARPLSSMDALRTLSPYYYDWLDHWTFDSYWKAGASGSHLDAPMPATLSIGGWYDIFAGATMEAFLQGYSQSPVDHNLIMGPWAHNAPLRHYLGERNFGPRADEAATSLDATRLDFFDRHLRELDVDESKLPTAKLFLMDENRWASFDEYEATEASTWFLHSKGNANSAHGDGTLNTEDPGVEPPDSYIYDPDDPVPTVGGSVVMHGVGPQGPLDQRRVERRTDVLVYTSPALEHPLSILGSVQMILWAMTSARDTDFTAKLAEVLPDGRAWLITDGIVRARFRSSLSEPEHIEPGEPFRYEIRMGWTGLTIQKGHRLRVEISSSNFPRFDRNSNTGDPPPHDSSSVPAHQTILHSATYPSQLVLPVLP